MIASVRCPVCDGWHTVKMETTKDLVGLDGIRRVELVGRMEPCPNTKVAINITRAP